MEKIVLIGPVYPYKGDIAHYTSLMYQSLKTVIDFYKNKREEELIEGVWQEAYRFSWDRMREAIEGLVHDD